MPKLTENPSNHIVSFRVNNAEKAFLAQLAKQKGVNVSDYLRRFLALLEENSDRALQLRNWL